ncbi:hypothetical protein HMPREF3034_02351, partial [Prevotella sp. DNF00663]
MTIILNDKRLKIKTNTIIKRQTLHTHLWEMIITDNPKLQTSQTKRLTIVLRQLSAFNWSGAGGSFCANSTWFHNISKFVISLINTNFQYHGFSRNTGKSCTKSCILQYIPKKDSFE